MEMISENKAANLEYQSFGSAKSKRYHVHPYLLKEFRQRWYLLAYDVTAHRLKTFSLDRFIYLEAMDEVFMVDNAFDPALYFQYCYGITYSESVPQTVVLCFTGDSRHYIRTMPLHFSQQILEESETSLTISLLVQPSYELISDILSFGPACKVLAPDSLSTAICTALQETIANY
jgi:predicted DNA-binding transcriptional regulator YafY